MRRRSMTVAIFAAIIAVLSATPAAAERSCGAVHGGQGTLHDVTIREGRLSCVLARAAAKEYADGRASFHGPPSGTRSDQYDTLPGGWRCSVIEQGAVGCARKRPHDPPEGIAWIVD